MQLTNFGVHLTGKHAGDTAMAVTMDGDDIVVPGTVNGFGAWGLVRYLPDGTRDPSFGQGGRVITHVPNVFPVSVAVDPEENLLLTAYQAGDTTVARYLSDGSLDPSFGSGGFARPRFPDGHVLPRAMTFGPDGSIVVAGQFADKRFALIKLTADGTLDDTFGDGGLVTTKFGGGFAAAAIGVALQADDAIVASGCRVNPRASESALARYEPDGTLDPAFGGNGKIVTGWESGSTERAAPGDSPSSRTGSS
jgi:uncharacterized delta-60 repeat protein